MALSTYFILSLFFYCSIHATNLTSDKPSTTDPPAKQTTIPTTAPTTAPPLEFSCYNGKVDNITGVGMDMNAVVIYQDNGTMCHITDELCKWQNKSKTLHVRYDESEKHHNIVAGQHPHYYELACKAGYVASANASLLNISLSTPYYNHKEATETPSNGIQVQLYKENQLLNAAVDIGETLTLKITGPGSSSIIPISCTAMDPTNSYLLWDNKSCTSNDHAIMNDIWTTTSKNEASIEMYAFRFVDSSSVTIECSAYICPSSDEDCNTEVKSCLSTIGKTARRRRSSNLEINHLNEYKEETSSVSFTVVNRYDGTNGSKGVSGNIVLYLTAMLITMCFLQRE